VRFGDLLVLVNSREVAVHVCAYAAEDFVFTKEGKGVLNPWVIMKLGDVPADFPNEGPLQVRHLRRRENAGSKATAAGMQEGGSTNAAVNAQLW
jgi:hypothetical protein